MQGKDACTPVLIVPAGGQLMYRSTRRKVCSIQYTYMYSICDVCKRQSKTVLQMFYYEIDNPKVYRNVSGTTVSLTTQIF